MDRFKRSVLMAYFSAKDAPLKERWARVRGVAGAMGLSAKAKEKLEWVIFYQTVGQRNAQSTASYFGISRKTLHKWLKRFEERNLKSLEEKSRAPIKKREWQVSPEEEQRIFSLRKSHLKWGKKKIRKLYLDNYEETISTWKIERVIRKWKLYPDKEKHNKYLKLKAKRKEKTYLKDLEREDPFGFLWHIDAIIIWWYGVRKVIFTALEDTTKIAFARVYKTNSSTFSEDFLQRLVYLADGRVNYIHSDNGSEFEGSFSEACNDLKVTQIYSRPHTPKDNPSLERFNWTLQDEWLSVSRWGLMILVKPTRTSPIGLPNTIISGPTKPLTIKRRLSMLTRSFLKCYRCALPAQQIYNLQCIMYNLCVEAKTFDIPEH